jgi:flagellar protein FlbT
MPLKLKLAPGEKIVVNGAVMTNGHHGAVLTINNHASIMREGHILQEDDTDTPTKRVYFMVQTMLLSPPPTEDQFSIFHVGMKDLRECYRRPITIGLLDDTDTQVASGNYYKALAALRKLIDYEAQLLRLEAPSWRRQPRMTLPASSPRVAEHPEDFMPPTHVGGPETNGASMF